LLPGLHRDSKINVGLEPGLGFKMSPFTMYAGANKGRLKGYVLHPTTVKID